MASFKEYQEFDWDRPLKDQPDYRKARDALRLRLIEIMKQRNKYEEPFKDMIEQYISMWENIQLCRQDIAVNGVRIEGKENSMVKLQTAVNKQMMVMLDKFKIDAGELKSDDGADL